MITILAYLVGTILGFYFGKFHERSLWFREIGALVNWAEKKIEDSKDGE